MSTASPRDVIAKACFDPGQYAAARWADETISAWQARASEAALTAAGYRVVREGELDAARQALIQQRAFIRHWIDDVNGGLKPTVGSLRAASDMVDAALRALAGEAK